MTSDARPRIAVVVVAAGSGTRLGHGVPKAFARLDTDTLLAHALRRIVRGPAMQVVVVAPAGWEAAARADALREVPSDTHPVSVVTGGPTRQASVAAGLVGLAREVEVVLVHDAARALTPVEVFARVIAEVDASGAGVVPVLPVVDTLTRVADAVVVEGVDRADLRSAQTPQGFPRSAFDAAARAVSGDFTDDAAVFTASGGRVVTVDGDADAFKITTPPDLDRARRVLQDHAPAPFRVGVGTDVHRFGGTGALRLAGLDWPGEQALDGHSDGDAVAHAIVDALLAAAGLGDIGSTFGTDDPRFAGAHGDVFLAHTSGLLRAAGWRIGNVSVQIQTLRPRFAPRRAEAEASLSASLGGAPVSVSATTTDGLGFTGRGEGVAATAVALIVADGRGGARR